MTGVGQLNDRIGLSLRGVAQRLVGGAEAPDSTAGDQALRFVAEFEQHGTGWFWQTDRTGRLTYLSNKVAQQLDRPDAPAVGALLTQLLQIDQEAPNGERTLAFHLSSRTTFSEYSVCSTADTAPIDRWWSMSGRPAFDARGNFTGFIGTGSDLTAKRRSDAEIKRLALFDSLTGLANRQRMRMALDSALAHGTAARATSLLLLDLDRFKQVNDTLGHQTGDALLKQVAQRLVRAVGEGGLVGRLGGDEFQVMLPGEGSQEKLAEIGREIIAALSHPYFIEGSSISIGCSIGMAIAPRDGLDSEILVRNADLALYAAKADGRGVARFFREEMLLGAQGRRQLEDDLRQALGKGELYLAYQPVVSTADEQIKGFEALLRWDHPVRGAVPPSEFISIAEECGLIEPIGEWVLRTACIEAAGWPGAVRVAVNVSPIQFANPALPALVTSALAKAGLPPARLELEITESVFLHETASSERMFRNLKAIGVRLALDDFGTGYSSLGYLKTAPFDKIKIDQSFVRGAAVAGNRNAAIIKAIVTLADTLGMETTAEGVEVQDEIALVRELGCSHIQGYVYGRPMRAEAALQLLGGQGGQAEASGFKVSRSPRSTMLRWAAICVDGLKSQVRIRNLSATGVMIDGFDTRGMDDGRQVDVQIELLENQLVPATIRWAKDGKAGLQFDQYFDMERLNAPKPSRILRRNA